MKNKTTTIMTITTMTIMTTMTTTTPTRRLYYLLTTVTTTNTTHRHHRKPRSLQQKLYLDSRHRQCQAQVQHPLRRPRVQIHSTLPLHKLLHEILCQAHPHLHGSDQWNIGPHCAQHPQCRFRLHTNRRFLKPHLALDAIALQSSSATPVVEHAATDTP